MPQSDGRHFIDLAIQGFDGRLRRIFASGFPFLAAEFLRDIDSER